MNINTLWPLILILALPFHIQAAVTQTTLLEQLSDRSHLAEFRPYTTHQLSSADPTGGNGDIAHYVRWENGAAILADVDGPGAMVRLWSANADLAGTVRIFIDGNSKPVIEAPFVNLFNGRLAPFGRPLSEQAAGGNVSYFPIPYAKHLKVTLETNREIYYQLNYISYPSGTEVESFHLPLTQFEQYAVNGAGSNWARPLAYLPKNLKSANSPFFQILKDGQTDEILNIRTSGEILDLSFIVNSYKLRNLVLRGYFDNHTAPDVESPLADFVGNVYDSKTVVESFFSYREPIGPYLRKYHILFPMPFGRSARFTLENGTGTAVYVHLNVKYAAKAFDPVTTGYFHAQFMQETVSNGVSHHWLNVTGDRGHFAGVVQSMVGADIGFLEGDEQIRVDDERFGPADYPTVVAPWNGTGSEDYFNCGWYFAGGPSSRPLFGDTIAEWDGRASAYRWHILDTPVFQNSIDAQIEHGETNNRGGSIYSSTVFWYSAGEAKPRFQMPPANQLEKPHH